MKKLARVLGIVGFVLVLSVPLTLFLWDWQLTWVALTKLVLGIVAILVWLATNFGGIRERFQGRSSFYWGFATLFSLMALTGVVIANYVSHAYPYKIDCTEEQVFSLSDQTLELLKGLEGDVHVKAFYGSQQPDYAAVREYLERYRYASPRFSYEFIDPVVRLDLAERYKIHKRGPRILITHRRGMEEREERVRLGEPGQSPEEAITTALLALSGSESKRRFCFATGHGEMGMEGDDESKVLSLFVRDLQSEGFSTDSLSLLEQPRIPPSCEVVVLAGPRSDLVEAERESLRAHVERGGRVLAFLGAADTSSLGPLLREFGVELGNDTVINPKSRSAVEVVTDPMRYPKTHPIFKRFFAASHVFLNQLEAVLPLARSVGKRTAVPQGFDVVEIAASSQRAWAEVEPIHEAKEVVFDQGKDRAGPVPVGVTVERNDTDKGMRLAVFGSSHMVVNMAYQAYPFNRDLIMNTVAWLTHEEKKITIRPRFRTASLLRLKESQRKFITFFAADFLPLLILAFGITVWQVRRWS